MKKGEFNNIIKEELYKALNEEERLLKTQVPISDKKNRRMFQNIKKAAEELYSKYTKSGSKPGLFGIERNLQKWKDTEELEKINRWGEAWSKALKTATSYNDLIDTLSILPDRIKPEFEKKLLNISEGKGKDLSDEIIK